MAWLLVVLLMLLLPAGGQADHGMAEPPRLWPLPSGTVVHNVDTLSLDPHSFTFKHSLPAGGAAAAVLDYNFKLYAAWIFAHPSSDGACQAAEAGLSGAQSR